MSAFSNAIINANWDPLFSMFAAFLPVAMLVGGLIIGLPLAFNFVNMVGSRLMNVFGSGRR
jgi:hypothetical protein